MPPNPWRLISVLGLGSAQDILEITGQRHAFRSIDMAMTDLKIGALLDLVRSDGGVLCPPCAGHIGDWNNVAPVSAGDLDFHKAICASGYGYPLLDCFTQIKTQMPGKAATAGHWDNGQASSVSREKRPAPTLHAWNGKAFAPIGRSGPRFTPFVQVEIDGDLRSLVEVLELSLYRLGGPRFATVQGVIGRNWGAVGPMLTVLIEQAARSGNPGGALTDLISHAVSLDGTLTRAALQPDGYGFKFADQHYSSAGHLADHALIPLQALMRPHEFFATIADQPPLLPVISAPLMEVLSAVLSTHYPEMPAGCASVTDPFNPHLHWGVDDLGADRPHRNATRRDTSKVGAMRRLSTVLVSSFRDINPISSIMLPAKIFMLWPRSIDEWDGDALSELFGQVRPLAGAPGDAGQRAMQEAVNTIVSVWLEAHAGALSPYFMDRFGSKHRSPTADDASEANDPVEPGGFRDLTLRQASMIVCAFEKLMQRGVASPKSLPFASVENLRLGSHYCPTQVVIPTKVGTQENSNTLGVGGGNLSLHHTLATPR